MSDDEPDQTEVGGATHRVIRLGESLRRDLQARRRATGQTVRGFVAEAIEFEVPALLVALEGLGVSADAAPPGRPARLPLSADHARALRRAAAATGLPASLLLRVALGRLSRRRRRRAGIVGPSPGTGRPAGKAGGAARAARRPRRAACPGGLAPAVVPADQTVPTEGDAGAPARSRPEVEAADDPVPPAGE